MFQEKLFGQTASIILVIVSISLAIYLTLPKYDSNNYISRPDDVVVLDNNRYILLDWKVTHVYDVMDKNKSCYIRSLNSQLCYTK